MKCYDFSSKTLPNELISELIMCLPMMRLFDGKVEKNRWSSKIDPVNWKFEVLRQSREKAYNKFKNRLSAINAKFNSACKVRKLNFEQDYLDSAYFPVNDQLFSEEFFWEILQYLCFGKYNKNLALNDILIHTTNNKSAAVSRLCGRVIEYVVGSSNPFSVRKRISLGTMQPNDLPACLKQPARVMVNGGIHPQIRSDETEVYHLYNSNLKKKVGYISMFYHAKEKQQHNKPKIDHPNQPKIDDLLRGLARLQLDHSQQSGGVLVAVPSPQTTMSIVGQNSTQSSLMDLSLSTAALLPANIAGGRGPVDFASAFAEEQVRNKKSALLDCIALAEESAKLLSTEGRIRCLLDLGEELDAGFQRILSGFLKKEK
ncbi:hypothetical protein niasHT_028229 [Heterodera trifolii]|uniref:F-box domain-containing protein n=1 Tax=Heterodera trifolii TaxID=157864 RepID=A0ABD2K8W0_9BILA